MDRHYLDHNATTPLADGARAAMTDAFDVVGNPSSVHSEGREARAVIDRVRRLLAERVGGEPERVTLTSGATEANNLVLHHAAEAGWPIFVSAIEHLSVLDGPGTKTHLPVNETGVVDVVAVERLLPVSPAEGEAAVPFLVCVMLANSETGVVQPVRAIADLVHERGGYVHVDAVQALGKIAVDAVALGADYLSVSAHKFGGPKGVGALVRVVPNAPEITPMLRGGGQEKNVRAGTENIAGIAGMAGALTLLDERMALGEEIRAHRDWLEGALCAISPNGVVFGREAERLGNTICFAVPEIAAETAVILFDLAGIAVGSGSACSSGKVSPSHVLEAMGCDAETTRGAIRISLGPETVRADVEAAAAAWETIVSRTRKKNAVAA